MADPTFPTHDGPWVPRRNHTLLFVGLFLFASAGGHLLAFAALNAWAKLQDRADKAQKPVELVMIEVEPPKPPPPPPPEPPPEPPKPRPKPPPIKVAVTKEKPPPPPEEPAPPPPNEEAEEVPPRPVPLVVGISMSSTTNAGTFNAPVGNTAYGENPTVATDPTQVQRYKAPKYVPIYQVDRPPEVVSEVRIDYPAEARRAGVEGQVVMAIRIDETGKVVAVKVLSGPGYGLNEAAASAMRRFQWRPATQNGKPVATQIKYAYTFLLD